MLHRAWREYSVRRQLMWWALPICVVGVALPAQGQPRAPAPVPSVPVPSVPRSSASGPSGQGPTTLDAGGLLEVGGEAEGYWRALQVSGVLPFAPMGIRPFDGLSMGTGVSGAHPWSSRWRAGARSTPSAPDSALAPAGAESTPWWRWRLLRPGMRITANSALPAGREVGPAWTGRGLTGEVRFGAQLSLWRFHLQLEPVAWYAQNAAFTPVAEGMVGLRDPRFPGNIDLPQRFGTESFGRIDPGNSALWVELPLVNAGITTRAQAWGPAREYPLQVSANAGGFPQLYVSTRRGVPIGVGRLHLRTIGGPLAASALSPLPDSVPRWGVGLAVLFTPRGLPGLEVGATRFIHGLTGARWPTSDDFRVLVTSGLSGTGALNRADENQLASAFFRWQVAPGRVAVYGELLRDDYSLDLRRGLQYPDDLRTYTLGVERVLEVGAGRLRQLHAELVNSELPSSNRGERGVGDERKLAGPFPPYLHGGVVAGHTVRGQLLGAPAAYGGAGWRVGYTVFTPAGRRTVRVERQMRLDARVGVRGDSLVSREIRYGVVAEQLRFRGRQEWLVTLAPSVDLNRGLEPGRHVVNVRAGLSVRGVR